MSKPVKNLITDTYRRKFADMEGTVLIDIRGVEANDVNRLRAGLAQKQIKITVVKNSLVKKAIEGTALANLERLIDGPSAMVYGDSPVIVARELVNWAKQIEQLDFKGALMEGTVFGPEQFDALSKYPTRAEARAQAVQIILSPAQNLVGSILSPGRKIGALVKAIEEKLEKGEEIKKAG